MKRFYCTTCRKVKRVRRLPILDVTSYYIDEDGQRLLQPSPAARLGLCHFHRIAKDGGSVQSRTNTNNRLRITGQRSARRKK